MVSNHLFCLSKSNDKLSSHDNIVILKNLVKDPTCFKNPQNSSCIDLIIVNQPECF